MAVYRYVLLKHVGEYSFHDTVILGVFDDFDTVARIKDEQYASEEGDVFIIKVEANHHYSDWSWDKGHELCKTPLEKQRDEDRLKEQQEADARRRRKREEEMAHAREHKAEMARRAEVVRQDLERLTNGRCVFSADVNSGVMRHVVECYDEVQYGLQRSGDEFWDRMKEAHKRRLRWCVKQMRFYQGFLESPSDIEAFEEFKAWFQSHMTD